MRIALVATCALAVLLLALTTVQLRGGVHADAAAIARCRRDVADMDRRERLLAARLALVVAALADTPPVTLTAPEVLH